MGRLGILSLCVNDEPMGLRLMKGVTGFPSVINAAPTFVILGPGMDIVSTLVFP